jgi:proline-specific peptidase
MIALHGLVVGVLAMFADRALAVPSIEANVTFQHPSLPRDSQTWYKVVGNLSDETNVPLVTLHGGPGAGHNYLTNLDKLTTGHGIPVVFYDQIGNGLSTHFPEYRLNDTFWITDLFIAELGNLLSHLGLGEDKPYDLLGQSWGGMLASSWATTNPKGLRKLVISSSPASMSLWSEACSSWIDEMPQSAQDAIDVGEREQNYTSDAYQEVSSYGHVGFGIDSLSLLRHFWLTKRNMTGCAGVL